MAGYIKRTDLHLRDPFVLVEHDKYYLYGTRGKTCWGKADGFDCYVSTDLDLWEGPFPVFQKPEGFWADRDYWAPEVHVYQGSYYMFASFKSDSSCRGTQILKAKSPLGPFQIHSKRPVTPADWECLDGTLYCAKDGTPYLVFCHEWAQIKHGTICAVRLSEDLSSPLGEPFCLLTAGEEIPWIRPLSDQPDCFVTDGPFFYRCSNGALKMLWSSFGETGYVQAIATSDNGEINGSFSVDRHLLFTDDGGHGMIFRGLDSKLYLSLHHPNQYLSERPVFLPISEEML